MNMKKRAVLNLIAFFLIMLTNFIANFSAHFGLNVIDITNHLPIMFKPSGYAFFIWILIYILLAGWVIIQFLPRYRQLKVFDQVGYWFVFSCLFNIIWIVLWHQQQFVWTFLILCALLLVLMIVYHKVIYSSAEPAFLIRFPFCVYVGWVSVMTSVNVAVLLQMYFLKDLGIRSETWTILMLLVGTLFALWFTVRHHDFAYPLVFIWVYISIALKQAPYGDIVFTAWFMVALLVLSMVWVTIKNKESALIKNKANQKEEYNN